MTREQNEQLVRTGPKTLMGDFFRRYWLPILLAEELNEPDGAPVRATILSEKLLAFRDTKGRIGVIDEFCAHRRVSLWYGRNEECGIRCSYHGWKFDVTGQCVDIPSLPEDAEFTKRIKLKSYPAIEQGGVIWAYLGPPELQPPPPNFEWTHVPANQRFLSKRIQESNYLQSIEGSYDSAHVTFLHMRDVHTDPVYKGSVGNHYTVNDTRPSFEVVGTDGGMVVGVRRQADADNYYWRITPWVAPSFCAVAPRARHPLQVHHWVPIDDEHCWVINISYHPTRPLTEAEIEAMHGNAGVHLENIPGTYIPLGNKQNDHLMDREAQRDGRSFSGILGISRQDMAMQESPGPIVDRTEENLVITDKAIIFLRQCLLKAAQANRDGKPIPGLDPTEQHIRACSLVLPKDTPFFEGAASGIHALPGSEPVSL
jgi:phenylpropionate dioxygenase-like ring-hydroxylating dioxygenase large terminal subunit